MNRFFTLLLAASCFTAVGQIGSQTCSGWGGPGISVTSEHGNSILVGEQVDFLMLDNNTPMMICGSSFFTNPSSVTVITTSCVANQYISQSIIFNELGTFQILAQNGDGIGMTYCSLTIIVADLAGCTSPDFLEFNPQATIDDGSCLTPVVFGCTDLEACNFDEAASVDDDSCTYSGCIDSGACNFQEDAACDDGSCDYSCCPGPGCCSQGLFWDWEMEQCFPTNPADINLDGCVQLGDLLDLLSAYGDCGSEESAWQCGDPVSYQGYDYKTVQIGEQCWFAENLRAENYRNGDAIPSGLSNDEWANTTSGAVAVYGQGAECNSDLEPCDPTQSLSEYGRLYNWYAVDDPRGLCPNGWFIPTDEDWIVMEMALGLSEEEANGTGFRGTNQGSQMKTDYGWDNYGNGTNGSGTNSSGFSGLPGGYLQNNGNFAYQGSQAIWWSTSLSPSIPQYAWFRFLSVEYDNISRDTYPVRTGYSIRCLKD